MALRIHIIDDDVSTVEIVSLILGSSGYTVTSEHDGDMKFIDEDVLPDIIILDNKLGYEDGAGICKKLKSLHKTSHIPIILISALQGIGEIACNAGANTYLAKPFSMQQLMDAVASVTQTV